jgi:hypothetical protein
MNIENNWGPPTGHVLTHTHTGGHTHVHMCIHTYTHVPVIMKPQKEKKLKIITNVLPRL